MKTLAVLVVLFASTLAQANQSPAVNGPASQAHKTDTSAPAIAVHNHETSAPPQTDQKAKTNDIPTHPHDWVDRLNAGSTAVIALFTICLFAGTLYQVQNLRDVERAWLVVDSWTTPKELEAYQ